MSANRRRRTRRTRMVRHAGAHGAKRPNKRESDAAETPRERLTRADYARFAAGKGKRRPDKPQKSKLWARHTVDMAPHLHGTRNATRGVSSHWGGHWLRMRAWERGSFIRGKGLSRSLARIALYVQGDNPVGWTDDMQLALGWKRAAEGHDLQVTMLESVGHEMLEGM